MIFGLHGIVGAAKRFSGKGLKKKNTSGGPWRGSAQVPVAPVVGRMVHSFYYVVGAPQGGMVAGQWGTGEWVQRLDWALQAAKWALLGFVGNRTKTGRMRCEGRGRAAATEYGPDGRWMSVCEVMMRSNIEVVNDGNYYDNSIEW